MKGLRTNEENKFIKFFDIVQKEAEKLNKVFFLDSGECKDIDYEDMILDELTGWLVPFDELIEFEEKYYDHEDLDQFIELYLWVIPEINSNGLKINFVNF